MPPLKIRTSKEIKRNLCETICKKAFQISSWLILGTETGSSDQDICRVSLKHAALLCVPKAWSLWKKLWEAESTDDCDFPVTIEEVLAYMHAVEYFKLV